MKVFDKYSQYYDLLYADKNYQKEVNYIDSLIRKFAPEAKTILDLGCGTGVHDYLLSQLGYKVFGVDFSAEMILEANSKLENVYSAQSKSLKFEIGDIRTWRSTNNETFDVVVSLFHVMSYQTTNEDIAQAIQTAVTHLNPGGILIFDFWYGPGVLTDLPSTRIKRLENSEIEVIRLAEPEIFPNDNCVDVNYSIIIRDKISAVVEEIRETHKMRYLFLPELNFFLSKSNIHSVEIMDWLSFEKPNLSSWTACVVAKA